MVTAEIGLCWGSNTHLMYSLWTLLPTPNENHAKMKIQRNCFLICHSKHNDIFVGKKEKSPTLYHLPSRCLWESGRERSLRSFVATLSCHYLKQHIPVFQSFSHSVHDLMAGLMSCSLHVEGHRIVLMNHEKGSHTSPCEVFNNQLAVIHKVHPPKVCSVNKPRYWMFH